MNTFFSALLNQIFNCHSFFLQPTIFTDVGDDMKICREEIFGPVMSVQKFSSLDEVADRANRTRYGLGASIFTKDVGKAHYLSHAIRAGTVWYVGYYVIFLGLIFCVHHIRKWHNLFYWKHLAPRVNCHNVFDASTPFGGFKESGSGRELGEYGLEAYTEVKSIVTAIPKKIS